MSIYTAISLCIGIPSLVVLVVATINHRRITKSQRLQDRKIRQSKKDFDGHMKSIKKQ
jgi:hypothetical protein